MSKPKAVQTTLSSDDILAINAIASKAWKSVFEVLSANTGLTGEQASKVADAAAVTSKKVLSKMLGTPVPQQTEAPAAT